MRVYNDIGPHCFLLFSDISRTPMTTSVPPLEASLVTIMKQITSIMQISSRPSLKKIYIAKFICCVFPQSAIGWAFFQSFDLTTKGMNF